MTFRLAIPLVFVAAAVALLAIADFSLAQDTAPPPAARAVSAETIAEYRRRLRDYTLAWQRFDSEAGAYWSEITEKRRTRQARRRNGQAVTLDDYVLTQPPVYDGPPRPIDPSAPERPPPVTRDTKYVPTIPEMLASAQKYFQFAPQRGSEIEFKRAYAKALVAEGVSRELAVRIYAFETGGIGTYDVQSGLLNARPGAKPLSAAVGYNQLLITYTMHLLADQGDDLVRALSAKVAGLAGEPRDAMLAKIVALKRMVAFSRTVPADWNSQEKLGETQQGWGVQVMLLDIDVGPLLQARKLNGSIRYARMRGHLEQLSAAELQMMNLMGDGSGLDIITMPQDLRDQVPTANFFQRRGYERNAVASRNNTVARLLAVTEQRMDAAVQQQGARDLAASF